MFEYVYAIAEPANRTPGKPGIFGAPLRLVKASGVAALVSELKDSHPELGRDELLVHASVLEAALAAGTILPMRFGTVMEGAAAVRERLLEDNADELRRELDRLNGKVELRVRAVYEPDVLLHETAIDRRRELDTNQFVDALSPMAEAIDVKQAPHERVAVSASFLVDRTRVSEFDAGIESVARAQADLIRVEYTGPLPPHSFVELEASP